MPVNKDPSGARTVRVEVEVPGTPSEVWQAIATGRGISSWFVRTDVEEREGGAVGFHMGPEMQSLGTVTAWHPPRRFAYEEGEWAPEAPPLATEFTIEPRAGGSCLLCVAHRIDTSREEWDRQLESLETGWPPFFEVLRLYLGSFRGQAASTISVMGAAAGSEDAAWESMTRALGLAGPVAGQRPRATDTDVPPFDGVVERVDVAKQRSLLVTLERPTPGIGLFVVFTWGEQVTVALTLYLFGPDAATVAARDEPLWRTWLAHAPFVAAQATS